MGRQFGEAYVFCKECSGFAHLTGDIVNIGGRTFFDPLENHCHCGSKDMVALDAHTINVRDSSLRFRQTGRRYARYLHE